MQIDFTKLRRIPSQADVNKAFKELEGELDTIITENEDFFIKGNYPKRIDCIIIPHIISKSGLMQSPYPQVSFLDSWLSDKIKRETSVKFYELLFRIVNNNEE